MKRRTTVILIIVLVLIVVGISSFSRIKRAVYHPDELSYQRKFESVTIGMPELEVLRLLGEPVRTIVYNRENKQLLYLEKAMKEYKPIDRNPKTGMPNYYPPANNVFPEREITNKVLIYTLGTVTAYYFIAPSGNVEYRFVWTS